MKLDNLSLNLLTTITNLTGVPDGAVNIRVNGQAMLSNSSSNILIKPREDGKSGFILEVKPETRDETVHVPVILTKAGMQETVANTFIIGEGADVTIVAGCGIHNASHAESKHDGVHELIVRQGAHVKYIERHYGQGEEGGKRVMNPTTYITLEKGANVEMETSQIKGIDDTLRSTVAYVKEKANFKIIERLLTDNDQIAKSDIQINLDGRGGSGQVLSRSVARGSSNQAFRASLIGRVECLGHVECDSIIMDDARISSIPELVAEDAEAVLTHEAAIGRIAGEQLIKLMSLGLTEQEAIDTILEGFLR